MAKKSKAYITLENRSVPVHIYFEWRNNARISISKKGLNLRVPKLLGNMRINEYLEWCQEWASKQVNKDPKIRTQLFRREYIDGDTIQIRERSFIISMQYENRKTHSAKLIGDQIFLKLNKEDKHDHLQSSIRRLLSRVISAEYLDEVSKRVDYFNDNYFKEKINSIRIKYNQTNWGSCSAKKNINLSSRLLFAPKEVMDYVIVHELAHLKELNHSNKFWNIVESVMPDYKIHERWLKKKGHNCDF